MKRSALRILRCPACRAEYELNAIQSDANTVEDGFLTCLQCRITIPILFGFPLFAEQFLTRTPDLQEIAGRVFGKEEQYLAFLHAKQRKPAWDLYAAFQPFNESTQAVFPLIGLLKKIVRPGDFILDLWCRTGWSGELLAANFPEQHVIAVWESYAGVLGAKGFHYWLGSGKRLPNLDVIFHSPNNSLPFMDGSFALVHGLDTLHRYHHVPLIAECRRVVNREGAIFFPHCHLTNSEPDPYFDRGEDQFHGKEYEEYFSRLFAGTTWKGYVLSEKKLFDAEDVYILEDDPDTSHYNAAILLADKKYEGSKIHAEAKELSIYKHAYAVLNPLCDIDFTRRQVRPAAEAMDRGAEELFYRHPIYHQRLLQRSAISLSEQECIILYWAERLFTVTEIASRAGLEPSKVLEVLLALRRREVVHLQNVSYGMARLQSFYGRQVMLPERSAATLSALWRGAQILHPDKTYLIWPGDESRFSYKDCDQIVRMAAAFLVEQGVNEGDHILIVSESHPEFIFLFWASVLLGAVAVPVNQEMNQDSLRTIIERTNARLILTTESFQPITSSLKLPVIVFACSEDSSLFQGSFSDCLQEYAPVETFPVVQEDQDAVVLFTSGSTGKPKGVVLTHGSLFRSAEIMDREYGWQSGDVFLGVGALHTMSGLRNPCLAALFSGISVVLPGMEMHNPMAVMNLCLQYGVTLLNAGPAFLAYWNKASQKAGYFKDHTLRMVLCTGSSLHPVHRDAFEKQFRCPVYDYYGLTETSGVCILINSALTSIQEKGIGRATECVVHIVDENGKAVGAEHTGELAIYGENLMKGYLGDPALTAAKIRSGWFYTGDNARINKDGCIILLGRKDRMLIDKNGENLYPDAIEAALNQIEGVVESFVIGYQDRSMVNQIAALITLRREDSIKGINEAYIRTHLGSRLPTQHIPSLILIVDEIPRLRTAKVDAQAVNRFIYEAIEQQHSSRTGGAAPLSPA